MHDDSTPGERRQRPPIDRTLPIYRDDPLISGLTDEQVDALADVVLRLAQSYARRLEADGVTVSDIEAHGLEAAKEMAAARGGKRPTTAPPPPKQRKRRPSPARLAKWEAHWAAEGDGAGGLR